MYWAGGFLYTASGALALTTSLTGASWRDGFMRSPAGELVVSG